MEVLEALADGDQLPDDEFENIFGGASGCARARSNASDPPRQMRGPRCLHAQSSVRARVLVRPPCVHQGGGGLADVDRRRGDAAQEGEGAAATGLHAVIGAVSRCVPSTCYRAPIHTLAANTEPKPPACH